MNQEAREALNAILAKDPTDLTDEDKAVIRARNSYLTEEQKAVHAEVLGEQPAAEDAPVDVPAENAVEQPRTRRGRKPVEGTEQPEA